MEAIEAYNAVLGIFAVALLLVVTGMAKKQLVWKPRPVRLRRRRRR